MSLTPLQRIKIVLNYYYRKGTNSERVNKVYRNILKVKFKDSKYYENQFKPKDYGRHNNV
jgi:hypothetical protein